MKKYSFALITACLLSLLIAASPAMAQFGQAPTDAKEISAQEAAKSYPPPKTGYPAGELTAGKGIVKSPFSPHRSFATHYFGKDGKEVSVKRGAFILDPGAKQLFVNP